MVLHKRPWCRGQMIDGRSIDRVEEVVWCCVGACPTDCYTICCLDLYVITHSCSTIHFRSSHSDLHTMSRLWTRRKRRLFRRYASEVSLVLLISVLSTIFTFIDRNYFNVDHHLAQLNLSPHHSL